MSGQRPFEPRRPSRAERKAMAERARRRAEALEQLNTSAVSKLPAPDPAQLVAPAAAEAPAGQVPRRSLRRTVGPAGPAAVTVPRRPVRYPGAALVAGTVAGAVCTAALATDGLPVLAHRTDWLFVVAGLAAGAATLWWARRIWGGAGRRAQVVTGVLVAAVAAAAVWGSVVDPVVVNGRLYPATSETARAYRLAVSLRDDILQMSHDDQLLGYSPADAGLHNDEYQPAAAALSRLYRKYASLNEAALPSAQFVPVIDDVKSAAFAGQAAMKLKAALIISPDSTRQEQMDAQRATFVAALLKAGPELGRVAALYGIQLTATSGQPSE